MKSTWLACALVVLTLLFSAGCATTSTLDGAAAVDADIVSEIQDRLRSDPMTARHTFGVTSSSGVVTLTGSVKSVQARAQALNIAAGTPGVTEVVDRLYR